MNWISRGESTYLQFPRLSREAGLVHAICTRPCDVSMRTDLRAEERASRRTAFVRDWGLDPTRLHCCVQIHEPAIAVVPSSPDASTASGPTRVEDTDGLISATPGVGLMTFSADCPLVLLFDPIRNVVGMVHASWRNVVALATARLVAQMGAAFGSEPQHLLAGIGPSAGPEQYEVQSDVFEAAIHLPQRETLFPKRDGRMFFDLWRANAVLLEQAGLRAENVEIARICTMSDATHFYSFRREGAGCGHFALLAGLRES